MLTLYRWRIYSKLIIKTRNIKQPTSTCPTFATFISCLLYSIEWLETSTIAMTRGDKRRRKSESTRNKHHEANTTIHIKTEAIKNTYKTVAKYAKLWYGIRTGENMLHGTLNTCFCAERASIENGSAVARNEFLIDMFRRRYLFTRCAVLCVFGCCQLFLISAQWIITVDWDWIHHKHAIFSARASTRSVCGKSQLFVIFLRNGIIKFTFVKTDY